MRKIPQTAATGNATDYRYVDDATLAAELMRRLEQRTDPHCVAATGMCDDSCMVTKNVGDVRHFLRLLGLLK